MPKEGQRSRLIRPRTGFKGGSLRLLGSSLSSSTFVFCLLLSFCAQKAVLPETQQQSYDAEEGLIKLDVVVTDKLGKPVSGIARKDFKLQIGRAHV